MKEIGVGADRDASAGATGRWTATTAGRASRRRIARSSFGDGPQFQSAEEAITHYYEHPTEPNMTGDEFVTPVGHHRRRRRRRCATVTRRRLGHLLQLSRRPPARAHQGVRPRPTSTGFDRGPKLDLYFVHDDRVRAGPARARRLSQAAEDGEHPRRVHLRNLGLKQFRCAETEKFPHVTFFFNDYRERPFPGEDRQIVPSARRTSARTTRSPR